MVMIKRLTLATNSVESSGDPTGSFDAIGYNRDAKSLFEIRIAIYGRQTMHRTNAHVQMEEVK
jgi:hypothetical protein